MVSESQELTAVSRRQHVKVSKQTIQKRYNNFGRQSNDEIIQFGR